MRSITMERSSLGVSSDLMVKNEVAPAAVKSSATMKTMSGAPRQALSVER